MTTVSLNTTQKLQRSAKTANYSSLTERFHFISLAAIFASRAAEALCDAVKEAFQGVLTPFLQETRAPVAVPEKALGFAANCNAAAAGVLGEGREYRRGGLLLPLSHYGSASASQPSIVSVVTAVRPRSSVAPRHVMLWTPASGPRHRDGSFPRTFAERIPSVSKREREKERAREGKRSGDSFTRPFKTVAERQRRGSRLVPLNKGYFHADLLL